MSRDDLCSERLRTALDLADVAVEMLEQRLRRDRPELTDDEIRKHVARWYQTRPGATHGDAEGVPGSWPRRH